MESLDKIESLFCPKDWKRVEPLVEAVLRYRKLVIVPECSAEVCAVCAGMRAVRKALEKALAQLGVEVKP